MGFELREHQKTALSKMHNGCILNGSVGSGKSLTSLAYFYTYICGGSLETMTISEPKDLYIITTAMKRDRLEWPAEFARLCLVEGHNDNGINIVVDSWNNIKKYTGASDSFFIFDEQRVVGKGVWVKAFLEIARHNKWILLSATPGDNFMDYCPVFIANGFYKNRTDFLRQHVVTKPYVKYWAVDHYVNTKKLYYYRDKILVPMEFERNMSYNHMDVIAPYSSSLYKSVIKDRWNFYENRPIVNASELCYLLRRVVNSDVRRLDMVSELLDQHSKVIIFFNFTYEADLLTKLCETKGIIVAKWDGYKHEPLPVGERWVYLVQYAAGDSGWNCIETDTIIFYSLNYSYKSTVQAAGRIDRLNTPFTELYFYHIRSMAGIDVAINRALKQKKKFNESKYFSTL